MQIQKPTPKTNTATNTNTNTNTHTMTKTNTPKKALEKLGAYVCFKTGAAYFSELKDLRFAQTNSPPTFIVGNIIIVLLPSSTAIYHFV